MLLFLNSFVAGLASNNEKTSDDLPNFRRAALHFVPRTADFSHCLHKLVCVNGTKTVGKHVGKLLATNRTCLYSRQLFHQLFRVGKLVFDV